jgi:GTPase
MDKKKGSWVRKGMTLISPEACPASFWEFQAEVLVLHHQTTMRVGYAPIVHTGVIAQSAKIERMLSLPANPAEAPADLPVMRTGDRALVTFRWSFKPEYVKAGDILLFREGRAKGVGKIRLVASPHQPASQVGALLEGSARE